MGPLVSHQLDTEKTWTSKRSCVKTKDRYNNAKSRCPRGEIGRHKGLKIVWVEEFQSL